MVIMKGESFKSSDHKQSMSSSRKDRDQLQLQAPQGFHVKDIMLSMGEDHAPRTVFNKAKNRQSVDEDAQMRKMAASGITMPQSEEGSVGSNTDAHTVARMKSMQKLLAGTHYIHSTLYTHYTHYIHSPLYTLYSLWMHVQETAFTTRHLN